MTSVVLHNSAFMHQERDFDEGTQDLKFLVSGEATELRCQTAANYVTVLFLIKLINQCNL